MIYVQGFLTAWHWNVEAIKPFKMKSHSINLLAGIFIIGTEQSRNHRFFSIWYLWLATFLANIPDWGSLNLLRPSFPFSTATQLLSALFPLLLFHAFKRNVMHQAEQHIFQENTSDFRWSSISTLHPCPSQSVGQSFNLVLTHVMRWSRGLSAEGKKDKVH